LDTRLADEAAKVLDDGSSPNIFRGFGGVVACRHQAGGTGILGVTGEEPPILTPTESNWLESGRLLEKIYEDKGFTPDKLCELHFDLLIALSARSHGVRRSGRFAALS
jgi:hypothetical protein